jgi:hypothetical protein
VNVVQGAVIGAAVTAVVIALVARFELLCVRDLAETADVDLRYLNRAGWLTVIVLVIPIGGLAYLYVGRTRERRM